MMWNYLLSVVRYLRNWRGTFLALFVLALDNVCNNFVPLFWRGEVTEENYYAVLIFYAEGFFVFGGLNYALLLFPKIIPTLYGYDKSLLILGWLTWGVTLLDFHFNLNWRETGVDWIVFMSAVGLVLGVKLYKEQVFYSLFSLLKSQAHRLVRLAYRSL